MVSQVASVGEDEAEDAQSIVDAQSLGLRLRAVRRQMRLSLHAVETLSDRAFKSSVLGAYERGERNISVPRLKQLARLYNVPVDQLLPRDATIRKSGVGQGTVVEGAAWTSRVAEIDGESEKITIDLTKLNSVDGPERDPLRRFLSMIQVKRQDFNGRMITIRASDLHAIAYLFGTAPDALAHRLGQLGLLVQS
jgi:transcriptional regulator with XRE-family HTH domain